MFYSREILARKAPLGQIWMAANHQAKLTRQKLSKIDIIKICEQLLYPPVPMALRLSGILMGGVVIVYERKVKMLYDDANRLLVQLNETWRAKTLEDANLLPKRRIQARPEAVTLPENIDTDIHGDEDLQFPEKNVTMEFEQMSYFAMNLDQVDINPTAPEEDARQDHHQADPAEITLESYSTNPENGDLNKGFERFDMEGEDDTHLNLTSLRQGDSQIPDVLIPSPPPPPPQDKPSQGLPAADEIHPEQPELEKQRQGPRRKKAKKPPAFQLDYEQTKIPNHVYQAWLQDSSDIISRKKRNLMRPNILSSMKVAKLMELPPIALADGLVNGKMEIHYPAPILELFKEGGTTSPSLPQPQNPPPPSAPDRVPFEGLEDFHPGFGSHPIERMRQTRDSNEISNGIPLGRLSADFNINGIGAPRSNPITPGNSGSGGFAAYEERDISSLSFPSAEANSGRSNKKRPNSSLRQSGGSLEPVDENYQFLQDQPSPRLSKQGPTQDYELLVETGYTQTQHPVANAPPNKITDSIRMHLKSHFDAPGAPQTESLNNLAFGMNRSRAAQLFYLTCVLASDGFLRVDQKASYGNIIISKGPKM